MATTLIADTTDTPSAWGAVMSMALCVAVLIASGFMPVSLLILACLNVLVFHLGIYRRVSVWDTDPSPPTAARFAAAVSLIAWTGMIFADRFLAYS